MACDDFAGPPLEWRLEQTKRVTGAWDSCLIDERSGRGRCNCGIVYRLVAALSRQFCKKCKYPASLLLKLAWIGTAQGKKLHFVHGLDVANSSHITRPRASGYLKSEAVPVSLIEDRITSIADCFLELL